MNLEMMNTQDWSALRFAAKHVDHTAFLELVTTENINLKNKYGYDAFHLFVSYGYDPNDQDNSIEEIKVMTTLIRMKADVNTQCEDGGTPIYQAVMRQAVPIVAFLLENKADMRDGRPGDRTPIRLACVKEYDKQDFPISRLFMMCGAKLEELAGKPSGKRGPNEMMERFANQIEATKKITLILLGLKRRMTIFNIVGKDMLQYVAQLLFEARGRPEWNRFVSE